jgi:dephospho-CoA kinase
MSKIYNGIVIFGEMGAGKDTLADQFKQIRPCCEVYNMGKMCRTIMKIATVNSKWRGKERCLGQSIADQLRKVDINIMSDYILAQIYERWQKECGFDNRNLKGEAYDKLVLEQLSVIRKYELSVIVGGRTEDDLKYWRNKQYLIIGLKVNDEVRTKRLITRDGEKNEINETSSHTTETEARSIVDNQCDDIITNNGSLDDLKKQAENLLKKYSF